jgi:hypothetical protein
VLLLSGTTAVLFSELGIFGRMPFYAPRLMISGLWRVCLASSCVHALTITPVCLPTPTVFFFPVPLCALRSWYDAERQRNEIEESSSGPCMNQHVAPSGVTHLTDKHKERLSNELRAILEGWHGGPLELTSIYGIR